VTVELDTAAIPRFPDLAGKVAVVTGGSKGIGAASCRVLAANGVRVAVNARSRAGIDRLVAELERMRDEVERQLGPVDILLAYAGGFSSFTPLEEIGEDEWRDVIDANLTSTFLTVKAFTPGMVERRSGVIVTMASNAGRYLDKLLTCSYAAAKAGVIQFTRHAALELGKYGIRVNSIAPATVASERVKRIMDEESRRRTAEMSPLGRLGTPGDCAFVTLFLVSDTAGWLTGNTIDVAGGRIML
jgi:3-oxoacyl-[acyl-carrier protein] reductase